MSIQVSVTLPFHYCHHSAHNTTSNPSILSPSSGPRILHRRSGASIVDRLLPAGTVSVLAARVAVGETGRGTGVPTATVRGTAAGRIGTRIVKRGGAGAGALIAGGARALRGGARKTGLGRLPRPTRRTGRRMSRRRNRTTVRRRLPAIIELYR